MGYMKHDAVLATVFANIPDQPLPDIDAFRDSLPEQWQALVVGPIGSLTNGYASYAFLPDGSKEGWELSDEGDVYRKQFAELFDGFAGVVHVRFGGDDRELQASPVPPRDR